VHAIDVPALVTDVHLRNAVAGREVLAVQVFRSSACPNS